MVVLIIRPTFSTNEGLAFFTSQFPYNPQIF